MGGMPRGVILGVLDFCPLGRTSEPTGLLKMLVCMDSTISLLIAIVLLLVVPTPALVVVMPIVRLALRCFFPCFRIASLSPSVAVISEPACFDEEIVPFKSVLNWLDLSIE